MSNAVDTKVRELLQQWATAKDSENQWKDYRQAVEDQITALLGGFQGDLKELETGAVLTRSIKLPGIDVSIGYELSIKQAEIPGFLSAYPMMYGVLVKSKYEPVGSRQFLTAAAQDNEMGAALRPTFERKAKRPSYSIRKEKA